MEFDIAAKRDVLSRKILRDRSACLVAEAKGVPAFQLMAARWDAVGQSFDDALKKLKPGAKVNYFDPEVTYPQMLVRHGVVREELVHLIAALMVMTYPEYGEDLPEPRHTAMYRQAAELLVRSI